MEENSTFRPNATGDGGSSFGLFQQFVGFILNEFTRGGGSSGSNEESQQELFMRKDGNFSQTGMGMAWSNSAGSPSHSNMTSACEDAAEEPQAEYGVSLFCARGCSARTCTGADAAQLKAPPPSCSQLRCELSPEKPNSELSKMATRARRTTAAIKTACRHNALSKYLECKACIGNMI